MPGRFAQMACGASGPLMDRRSTRYLIEQAVSVFAQEFEPTPNADWIIFVKLYFFDCDDVDDLSAVNMKIWATRWDGTQKEVVFCIRYVRGWNEGEHKALDLDVLAVESSHRFIELGDKQRVNLSLFHLDMDPQQGLPRHL